MGQTMAADTIFIVDDDPSVRDSLSLLLSLRGYLTASFACAEDFLQGVPTHGKGCVLLDIRMPGLSGLDVQDRLRRDGRMLPVVVITAHGDVAAARQAFLAGAVDFIEKPFDSGQLLAAIETALSRGGPAPAEPAADPASCLSPREREVMALMVQGLHNRRIAERLGISPRTVEVHKARVMDKLGVRTLVELVRLADRLRA